MKIVKINLPEASGLLDAEPGCVVFWSFRDTTATSGSVFNLWDGSGNNSRYLSPFSLQAGQSTRDYIKKHDLPFVNGLFFELVSGTVVGQVTICLDHECEDHWQHEVNIVAGQVDLLDLGLA